MVEAHVRETGAPEIDLAGWLRTGCPMCASKPITPRGVFPSTSPVAKVAQDPSDILSLEPPGSNEAREHAEPELPRVVASGYAEEFTSWDALVAKYGQIAVSKLACIVKTRKDGTIKSRIITDLRRSGVSRCVRTAERIVFPRGKEVVADAVYLLGHLPQGASLEAMVADL